MLSLFNYLWAGGRMPRLGDPSRISGIVSRRAEEERNKAAVQAFHGLEITEQTLKMAEKHTALMNRDLNALNDEIIAQVRDVTQELDVFKELRDTLLIPLWRDYKIQAHAIFLLAQSVGEIEIELKKFIKIENDLDALRAYISDIRARSRDIELKIGSIMAACYDTDDPKSIISRLNVIIGDETHWDITVDERRKIVNGSLRITQKEILTGQTLLTEIHKDHTEIIKKFERKIGASTIV